MLSGRRKRGEQSMVLPQILTWRREHSAPVFGKKQKRMIRFAMPTEGIEVLVL